MADVLSQTEVELLLSALDAGSQPNNPASIEREPNSAGPQMGAAGFRHPARICEEQVDAFQSLQLAFSQKFSASLRETLCTQVDVALVQTNQLPYREFLSGLKTPACLPVLQSPALQGDFVLVLQPSLTFALIDRLMGGAETDRCAVPNRPLTEIELRVISKVIGLVIHGIRNTWKASCPPKLGLSRVESDPRAVEAAEANETVVSVDFEITLSGRRGIMQLCVPAACLASLWESRGAGNCSASSSQPAEARPTPDGETEVEMIVGLAEARLTADELRNLTVGDVIVTEKKCDAGVTVHLNGCPLFSGYPGVYNGRKAVRLGKAISPPKENRPRQGD